MDAAKATANFLNLPRSTRPRHPVGVQRRQGEPGPRRRGGKRGADGIRAKATESSRCLPDVDQRSPPEEPGHRQAGRAKAGIELELKSVTASVFFSSDPPTPTSTRASRPTCRCTRRRRRRRIRRRSWSSCAWEPRPRTTSIRAQHHARRNASTTSSFGRRRRSSIRQARRCHQDERHGHPERDRHPRHLSQQGAGGVQSPARHEISGWDNDTATSSNWFKA